MSARILVAGVGNIFFGDDAYGCEVIRRIQGREWSPDVRVVDFGIRSTHLAFELMSGYEGAILIDAVPRGGEPGTLYVIEPDVRPASATPDAHTMDLSSVFAFMRTLEGNAPQIIIIGCEPGNTGEGIGLSPPVERAVEQTRSLVRDVLEKYFDRRSSLHREDGMTFKRALLLGTAAVAAGVFVKVLIDVQKDVERYNELAKRSGDKTLFEDQITKLKDLVGAGAHNGSG